MNYLSSIARVENGSLRTVYAHPVLSGVKDIPITQENKTLLENVESDNNNFFLITWEITGKKRLPKKSTPIREANTLGDAIGICAKGLLKEAQSYTLEQTSDLETLGFLYQEELKSVIKFSLNNLNTSTFDGYSQIGDVTIKTSDLRLFEILLSLENGSNVLMIGPSGSGKTSIPEALAKDKKMKFLRVNCASIRDPEEWFGFREALDGNTIFVETPFTKTLREGNAIVVLDELNRLEPWLHNSLLPLLDHSRRTIIHNQEITIGDNVLFVATLNLGGKFTGTFMLDAALRNRFDATIFCEYLPKNLETRLLVEREKINIVESERIVNCLADLRKYTDEHGVDVDVSTRTALKIARLSKSNLLPLIDVITYVVLNNINEPSAVKNMRDLIMESIK